jgi:hypothetical protein
MSSVKEEKGDANREVMRRRIAFRGIITSHGDVCDQ